MKRCRQQWGADFDPYRHFDLDYVVITPNMDPKIRPFEIVRENGEDIVVRTGFGATIRRHGDAPMPVFEKFSITRPEEMADFDFDDPADPRRFFQGGDDQINCVGDALARNIPSWDSRVSAYADDFAVFGSVCEPYEYLWRIISSENALRWLVTGADLYADFVDRIGKFLLDFARAQIEAGKGRLSAMYIWGDVAYCGGMLFGATRWRKFFKRHVQRLIDLCHSHNLPVVYHGCGNASEIFDDLIEIGLDACNPLEVKSGLDVVELKKEYAGRLAFVGNIDVRALATNNRETVEREILYKLQAASGGGYIVQSDHSIPGDVDPATYEYLVRLVRQNGKYPLRLK
ncbi:hypothetical protein FJY63_06470 [Candidatus Sumerlaeota bacterium]|nr:hypothetical protein [Candidatus Sumerlaeota bacterium]